MHSAVLELPSLDVSVWTRTKDLMPVTSRGMIRGGGYMLRIGKNVRNLGGVLSLEGIGRLGDINGPLFSGSDFLYDVYYVNPLTGQPDGTARNPAYYASASGAQKLATLVNGQAFSQQESPNITAPTWMVRFPSGVDHNAGMTMSLLNQYGLQAGLLQIAQEDAYVTGAGAAQVTGPQATTYQQSIPTQWAPPPTPAPAPAPSSTTTSGATSPTTQATPPPTAPTPPPTGTFVYQTPSGPITIKVDTAGKVTATDKTGRIVGTVLPEGAASFDTGILPAGSSWTDVLTEATQSAFGKSVWDQFADGLKLWSHPKDLATAFDHPATAAGALLPPAAALWLFFMFKGQGKGRR